MMDNIIDIILELREKNTCFDHSKAEYTVMLRGLHNEHCKFHEHVADSEDISKLLDKYLVAKKDLTTHLFGFMNLIEELDVELKDYMEGDA